MSHSVKILFSEGQLDEALQRKLVQMHAAVDALPQDQFLNSPENEIVDHIVAEFELDPLELFDDKAEMDQREIKLDVTRWESRNPFRDPGPILTPAVEVTISIPFSGDPSLWQLRPRNWQSFQPSAHVSPKGSNFGNLEIIITQPLNDPKEHIITQYGEELRAIQFYLNMQREQINKFNALLPSKVEGAVRSRKDRLKKQEGITDLLGIPLRRRDGAPPLTPIPLKRKLVRPLPPAPKSGVKSEPGITAEDYEHILSVIRHEGRTFESTPKTLAVHDEEGLRDLILAHLNGHYQGLAVGEAFRRKGKTDIRIEDCDRAAFVAECKVWRGAKELTEAVTQLLGYLTWRDCKAALVIFNKKNAKFSDIIAKVPDAIKSHPNFRTELQSKGGGEWRFIMTSLEDEGRFVYVQVFLFNLYAD